MSYYFEKRIKMDFDAGIARVKESLAGEGFGVLTEIDFKDTMKKKLNVDFRRYTVLGVCNPPFAHRALQVEDKIGLMLPCNVIIQEISPGRSRLPQSTRSLRWPPSRTPTWSRSP